MRRSLMLNDALREPGKDEALWQVVDATPRDGWIKLFNFHTHQEEYQSLSDINDALVNGRLALHRPSAPRVSVAAHNDPKLDESLQTALAHVRLIENFQRKYHVSLARAYAMAKEDAALTQPDMSFVSRATMYRYVQAKQNGLPLLRGDKNKGNRNPRYDERIYDLVVSAANSLFLKPGSRWSLSDLVRYINDQAQAQGWLQQGRRLSREFVRRCIYDNASVDPEIDRMDPKLVAAAKSIARNRIVATTPFERVEQDAVHLPFVVRTAHGDTSNVYLVHAVDCCTGMPVGWHLVIGSPAESDGLRCVESILFSKKTLFQKLRLEVQIDVFGTPHQLIFDNGPEARGERMHRLVRLGIDVMHCKSRHAHGKPFIERLNRSLKEALQTLPGCTRMDGKDGQRDPIKQGDPLMGPEELEQWIVRWYYESWAHTSLKRHLRTDFHDAVKLGHTPAMRWRKMTEELAYALPLPPSLVDWHMTLYEHEIRTLSRKTGITCRGFNYRGDNLPYLLERYGETHLKVLINPDDYRQIFVDEGDGRPLVVLTEEFVDDSTPAYSFSQMQEALQRQRAQVTEESTQSRFRQDVQLRAVQTSSKPARKKQSRAEKNRAVAEAVKQSTALHRAATNPLSNHSTVTTTSSPLTVAVKLSLDDVPALPVLSRVSGKEQK